MAFDAQLLLQLAANLTSPLDLTTVSAPLQVARQITYVDGAGAGAANLIFSDTRTIAPSATDSLDLAGVLTSPLGGSLTFARIKTVLVAASLANANNVLLTRPASNPVPLLSAAANIAIKPGGLFLWTDPSAAGVVVTAGTGDLLDMVNSAAGTSVTYDIVIIGASS